jgi:hypothetical protein
MDAKSIFILLLIVFIIFGVILAIFWFGLADLIYHTAGLFK